MNILYKFIVYNIFTRITSSEKFSLILIKQKSQS